MQKDIDYIIFKVKENLQLYPYIEKAIFISRIIKIWYLKITCVMVHILFEETYIYVNNSWSGNDSDLVG